jgi:hypothetical protein
MSIRYNNGKNIDNTYSHSSISSNSINNNNEHRKGRTKQDHIYGIIISRATNIYNNNNNNKNKNNNNSNNNNKN